MVTKIEPKAFWVLMGVNIESQTIMGLGFQPDGTQEEAVEKAKGRAEGRFHVNAFDMLSAEGSKAQFTDMMEWLVSLGVPQEDARTGIKLFAKNLHNKMIEWQKVRD